MTHANTTINVNGTPFIINLDLDHDDTHEGGMTGDGFWTFPSNVAATLSTVLLLQSNEYGNHFETSFNDRCEDGPEGEKWADVDLDDADEVAEMRADHEHYGDMILDLDAGFAALAYLAELPEGDRPDCSDIRATTANAYWVHHDASHAADDCSADVEGVGVGRPYVEISILDASDERRAYLDGAIAAARAGVDVADIVTAIVDGGKVFRDRFDEDLDVLGDFLSRCNITLKD